MLKLPSWIPTDKARDATTAESKDPTYIGVVRAAYRLLKAACGLSCPINVEWSTADADGVCWIVRVGQHVKDARDIGRLWNGK